MLEKDRGHSGSMSRRSFIKGVTISAAASAGLTLAGCNSSNTLNSETNTEGSASSPDSSGIWEIEDLGTPTETLDCELCVLGAGGTGLAAGIQAKQLGVDVICLEKKSATGGSFIGSEGLFAVGSHWQQEAGVTFNVDDIIQACLDFHHWVPSPFLYENFFNHTAGTIDWLESLGVKFDHVQALGDSWVTWHVYAGTGSEGTGVTFMKSFGAAATDIGLDIELECSGKRLVMEDGKVAGVLAIRDDGTVVRVNCKAVIIGTGGYANNKDMIASLNGADANRVTASGMDGRDGDGLKMMVDAGGKMSDAPGCIAFYGPILPGTSYGSPVQAATCMQPTLWVNQDAARFVREDMFLKNFAFCGQAVSKQDRVITICNRATLERYENQGTDVGVGVYVNAGEPLADLTKNLQDIIDKGNDRIYQGDTLAKLAEAAGLDPDALQATFDQHKKYVASGADLEFGKPAKYLFSMAEGPYYAFEVNDGLFCTCGAIKVTPATEVKDSDGNIIRGLYAGGCDAGGFYGDTYDVGIAGGSCASWAINSGRLAAKHAAVFLGYAVGEM